MPTNIRVIHARDFIRATPEGHLDLEESRRLLEEIASAAGTLVNYEILLDTRNAQTSMSVTDLWHLCAELGRLGGTFRRKTAILCKLDRIDQAEFFALCAENRGFRIAAFTSFEDAIEWLISNEA